jgi:peptidoglycan/xylan/chitin deacetylase (PgdA/CDA1 family)
MVLRRQFVNGAVMAGAGVLTGVAVSQGVDRTLAYYGAPGSPQNWMLTVRPEPARGAAHLWWSAEPAAGRRLAVTFDDGPTEQFTAQVLDLLARAGVPATFFVIGELVRRHVDLVHRARDAGHELANHSQDHVSAAVSDRESVRAGVLRGSDTIEKVAGIRPRWFRPPRGEVTTATLLAAREAQVDLALWSLSRGDAPDSDSAGIARHLIRTVHPGAVVNLHDGIGRSAWAGVPDRQLIRRRRAEIAVLLRVFDRWKNDGYTFCTLSELVAPRPGQVARDT